MVNKKKIPALVKFAFHADWAPGRYSLIPKPMNVTLNGNRTFEYVIKDFKTEIIMDYLGGSNVIKRAPQSRRDRQKKSQCQSNA